MKKKYLIENVGYCGTTRFEFELTETELELIINLFDLNNRNIEECYQPELFIYDLIDEWKPLNKNFYY